MFPTRDCLFLNCMYLAYCGQRGLTVERVNYGPFMRPFQVVPPQENTSGEQDQNGDGHNPIDFSRPFICVGFHGLPPNQNVRLVCLKTWNLKPTMTIDGQHVSLGERRGKLKNPPLFKGADLISSIGALYRTFRWRGGDGSKDELFNRLPIARARCTLPGTKNLLDCQSRLK